MASPIILILGGGVNTGVKVAQKFAANGFKIALVTRPSSTHQDDNTRDLILKHDFTDPTNIKSIFDEVKTKLGVPNVVVYNAYKAKFTPDTLSLTIEDFASSLTVNTTSVYAAAKEAVAGFDTLPADAIKSFIFTGNKLNVDPIPGLLDLGAGKSATAYMIQSWSKSFAEKGYTFYYGDERKPDGAAVGQAISGENHAEFYLKLAQEKKQGPWDATFVGGKGYVDFSR